MNKYIKPVLTCGLSIFITGYSFADDRIREIPDFRFKTHRELKIDAISDFLVEKKYELALFVAKNVEKKYEELSKDEKWVIFKAYNEYANNLESRIQKQIMMGHTEALFYEAQKIGEELKRFSPDLSQKYLDKIDNLETYRDVLSRTE